MKKLLFNLLLLAIYIPLHAQNKIAVTPASKWVQPEKLEVVPPVDINEVSDGYLFVLLDYQYNIEEETGYYHLKKKLYTESGVQSGAETNVNFDPTYEKLIFHSFNIIRNGSIINKFSKADIKVIQRETNKENHLYDGSLLAYIVPEDVRPGDEIEYSYSIKGRNPLHKGRYSDVWQLSFYDPTIRYQLKILSSPERELNFTFTNEAPQPAEGFQGELKTYTWNLDNQKGIIKDADCPPWYTPYAFVEISEYKSWQEIIEWAIPLYQVDKPVGSEIKLEVQRIEEEYVTKEQKLVAALEFVQNNIRYTGIEAGIGGYKPTPPDQVMRQRFGDCKGKSLLLCKMLELLQIQSYPALVHTYNGRNLPDMLPSPQAFNHCVVVVEISGNRYWYDPTNTLERGHYDLRDFPDYGYGLIIGKGESDLVKIRPGIKPTIELQETFDIEEIGKSATLTVTTSYSGYEADYMRYNFSNQSLEQISKNYLNFYAASYPSIESLEKLTFSDDSISNYFTTYERYFIRDCWEKPDSSRELIEVYFYASLFKDKIKKPASPIRTMPLRIPYPLNISHLIQVNLPEPWTIKEEVVEITAPGLSFSKNISYHDNSLFLDYRFRTEKSFIEASQTKEFIAKLNKIDDELGFTISYDPGYTTAGTEDLGLNPIMITACFLAIFGSSVFIFFFYQHDPNPEPVEKVRDSIGGWLLLPALGLFLSPIRMMIDMADMDYFDLTMWKILTDAQSAEYNPLLAGLLPVELMVHVFTFMFTIFLAVLFIQRRSSFPLLYQAYLIGTFVFLAADLTYIGIILNHPLEPEDYRELTATLISTAIWVPYMRVSLRVKETFIKTLRRLQVVPPPLPVKESNLDSLKKGSGTYRTV